MYLRNDDPDFHEDGELSTIFEEGIFYQESLDGSKVAIIPDLLGVLPSSSVRSPPASTRKRSSAREAPSTLTPLPMGRRSKLKRTGLTPQEGQPAGVQGLSSQPAAMEAERTVPPPDR